MEIPDELLDSKPSPTNFSQPPFQPINSRISNETSPSPSSYTDPTPILSPMSSTHPDAPSPMTDNQLDLELNNFITQQKHLHNTNNALTTHQLTHSASTSESSTHSVHIASTRAQRVFERKHPKLHLNSLLAVYVHSDYIPINRNTLTPQSF